MNERQSQCRTILEYLMTGKGITQIEASDKFRITRLAARVSDLRKRGHNIVSVQVGTGFGSFVRYILPSKKI